MVMGQICRATDRVLVGLGMMVGARCQKCASVDGENSIPGEENPKRLCQAADVTISRVQRPNTRVVEV